MPVESAADRAAFFDPAEFGITANWAAGAVQTDVNGILSDPFLGVAALDGLTATSAAPEFVCAATDVPAGAGQGDLLTIGSAEYRVKELRPSGAGLMRVSLAEA